MRTPEYAAWIAMKARCYNPKTESFPHYGGRGIIVCSEWIDSYDTFLRDVGPRPSVMHSLERSNTNGNYEPGNVKWATSREQNNNRRFNHFLEFNGKRQTVTQWSRDLGVNDTLLFMRLKNGWSVERALTTPRRRMSR